MTDDERREGSSLTPTGGSQALAMRASSLAARGLKALHSRDSAKLIDALKAISAARYEDEVIRILRTKIPELIQLDAWSLLLTECDATQQKPQIEGETETRELRFEILAGEEVCLSKDEVRDLATKRFKLATSIAGWVAQKRETVLLPNAPKDLRFALEVDGRAFDNTASLLASPLRFQNECLGVIELVNREGSQAFSEADAGTLETLADFAAIAIAGARHVKRIHELIITDEKTGLYDARHLSFMLDAELHRSKRYGYEFSLVAIDMGLTALSEFLSYDGFNQLIEEIVSVVKSQCRLIDCAFSHNLNEFDLLLPQTSKENGSLIAARTANLLAHTKWSSTKEALNPVIACVGFPADGETKIDLLHNLDTGLHAVRIRGTPN